MTEPRKFGTDIWLAQAQREAREKECPRCEATHCLVVRREFLTSDTFSLAGAQLKLSGRFEITLSCSACGLRARLYEPAQE